MPDLIVDVREKAGHESILRGPVFKGEKEEKDEDYLKVLCPDTDSTFLGHLSNAVKEYGWKPDLEGFNEYDLFLAQYAKLKQYASRRLGVAALELFDRYQRVVEAAALYITTEGTETGHFYGPRAKVGSIQWFMRPIVPESVNIDPDHATDGLIFTPSVTGAATPIGVVGRNPDGVPATYTLEAEEQILLIFGYVCNLNPRAILRVQEKINDGVGVRLPIDIYEKMNITDVGLVTRPGCLVVNEGKTLEIAAEMVQANVAVDIMPFGVDICTAAAATLTSLL